MRSLVIFASRPLCFALLQSSFLLLLLLYKITRKKEEDERERDSKKEKQSSGMSILRKTSAIDIRRRKRFAFSWNNFQATMNETRAFN